MEIPEPRRETSFSGGQSVEAFAYLHKIQISGALLTRILQKECAPMCGSAVKIDNGTDTAESPTKTFHGALV